MGARVKKFLLATVAFGVLTLPRPIRERPTLPPAPAPYYAAPIAVPIFTWTGCYIGGTVGGVWGNTTDAWGPNPAGFPFPGPLTFSTSFHSSGVTGGVEGGCNYQVSPWFVFGVEGDWQATSLSKTFTGTAVTPAGSLPFTQTFSSHWLSTVRARAGYSAGPWLFYVTGGAAFANVSYTDSLTPPHGQYRQRFAEHDCLRLDCGCRRRVGIGLQLDREGRVSLRRPAGHDLHGGEPCGPALVHHCHP